MRHRRIAALSLLVLFLACAALAAPEDLKCHLCGTVIPPGTKYYQVKGGSEVYCARCFAEAPRCSVCKLPTAAADIDPQTGACPRCLAKLPRCKACGKPIVGVYYTFSFTKGVYCADCKKNRPACYICGVPVGNDRWIYPDGRIICGECGERSVIDVEEIRRIMQDAQQTVEKRLGLRVAQPYVLSVQKLNGLPSSAPDSRQNALAAQSPLYGKELGLYRRTGTRSEIFLLFGLPPELLYEAAAHEYAHAWQAENSPPDLAPELREGFAQWVAADVLRAKGFRTALDKLEARTDAPYGTGYQQLKRLQQRAVLRLMLHNQ